MILNLHLSIWSLIKFKHFVFFFQLKIWQNKVTHLNEYIANMHLKSKTETPKAQPSSGRPSLASVNQASNSPVNSPRSTSQIVRFKPNSDLAQALRVKTGIVEKKKI